MYNDSLLSLPFNLRATMNTFNPKESAANSAKTSAALTTPVSSSALNSPLSASAALITSLSDSHLSASSKAAAKQPGFLKGSVKSNPTDSDLAASAFATTTIENGLLAAVPASSLSASSRSIVSLSEETLAREVPPPEFFLGESSVYTNIFRNLYNGAFALAKTVAKETAAGTVNYIAAPLLGKMWKGDEEYLQSVTGSDEILIWVKAFSKFVPYLTRDQDKETILIHLFASATKSLLKTPDEELTTSELITRILDRFEGLIVSSIADVKKNTSLEGRLAEKSDFTATSSKILEILMIPDFKGYIASFIANFLYDCYTAMEFSTIQPSFGMPLDEVRQTSEAITGFGVDKLIDYVTTSRVETAIRDIITKEGSAEVTSTLADYLVSKKSVLNQIKSPLANFICRKLSKTSGDLNAGNVSEFITKSVNTLASSSWSLTQFYQLFVGDLSGEARIPQGLRQVVSDLVLNEIIPLCTEKFSNRISQFMKAIHTEMASEKIDALERLGIKREAEVFASHMVNTHYDRLIALVPAPYASWLPPAIGRHLAKEIILHLLQNYAASQPVEAFHSDNFSFFINHAIKFTLNEVDNCLIAAGKYQHDAELRNNKYRDTSIILLNTFFPGGLREPLNLEKVLMGVFDTIFQASLPVDKESSLSGFAGNDPLDQSSLNEAITAFIDLQTQNVLQKLHESPLVISPTLSLTLDLPDGLIRYGQNVANKFIYDTIKSLSNTYADETRHPIEKMLQQRLPELREALPAATSVASWENWIPFARALFVDLPKDIIGLSTFVETFLPKYLFEHRAIIVPFIRESEIDSRLLENNPALAPNNQIAVSNVNEQLSEVILGFLYEKMGDASAASRVATDSRYLPRQLIKPIITKLLTHLVGRGLVQTDTADFNDFALRLFQTAMRGYHTNGALGISTALLTSFSDASVQFAPIVAEQLEPFIDRLPQDHRTAYLQELRVLLWDPASYQAQSPGIHLDERINEEISRTVGFESKINQIVLFSEGLSRWIINLTEEQLNRPGVLPSDLAPTLLQVLNSDAPEVLTIKNNLQNVLPQFILKGIVNTLSGIKQSNPEVNVDDLLLEGVNVLIHVLNDTFPYGQERAVGSWQPLSDTIVELVFPDAAELIPLPLELASKLLQKIQDEILPQKLFEWNERLYTYINRKPEIVGRLNATFQSNHVAVFTDYLSNMWIRDFIPHILQNTHEKTGRTLVKALQSKFGVEFSPSVETLISDTVKTFAEQYQNRVAGEKNGITLVSEWVGQYAEAFLLNFFEQTFSRVHQLDQDSQESGNGSIILGVMKRVVPVISGFYLVVKDLKIEDPRFTHARLVTKLQEAGVLNGAFPLKGTGVEEYNEDGSIVSDEDRALRHFTALASRILTFADIHVENAPFPEPVKEFGMEILKEQILARSIHELEQLILKNKGTMLLALFRTIKSAAKYIPDNDEDYNIEEEPASLHNPAVSPELNREIGEIIRHLLLYLPDQWFAPLLELRKLKQTEDEQLGAIFVDLLHDQSITTRVNVWIEAILPKIIPGQIVAPGTDEVGFEPAVEHVDFSPTEEINERLLDRETKKEGAEAFMRSIEKLSREYIKSKRGSLGSTLSTAFKRALPESMHRTVDILGDVFNFIIDNIVVPFFIGVLYIPYQVFRFILRLLLERLAGSYIKEFKEEYHEGMLLNVLDTIFTEIGSDYRERDQEAGAEGMEGATNDSLPTGVSASAAA